MTTHESRPSDVSRRTVLRGIAMTGAAGTLLATGGAPLGALDVHETVSRPVGVGRSGRVREYWLQIESFRHNLVPTGRDDMMGAAVTGSSYWAIGFRAYMPGWTTPLPDGDDIGTNSGIPGPTLRAHVGDTVRVHVRNSDSHYRWAHSFHVHGWRYTPDSDGAWTSTTNGQPGRAIAYGDDYTYSYTVPADAVGTWPYHDHAMAQTTDNDPNAAPVMELAAELGMFGIIAVTDHRTPAVDREFVLFFHDLYQADVSELSQDFDCFNGTAYLGNTPVFDARVGDRVRWRIAALGKEFHVFHLHGHRWSDGLRNVDSQLIGPSTTLTVEYTEDNPGAWLYHCHVTDHMAGGMVGAYHVTN
jgi:FtsP/CotA-like multicopper oxidase with cupredoxin domain